MIAEAIPTVDDRPRARTAENRMTSADRVKVKIERRAMLLRGAPVAIVVSAINALITLAVAWRFIDQQIIGTWACVVVGLAAVRLAVWRRFAQTRQNPHALIRFTQIHVAGMAVNGALWGALAPIFAASGMLNHAYLPFIIAGMTAAAISSAGASWKAVFAFNTPVLASLAVSYAIVLETGGLLIALVIILYGVATGYLAWSTEQMMTRAIRLRSRNDALLKALTRQVDSARDCEKRFRALVEASSDVTLIFSPQGVITYASPATEHALQVAPDSLVGRTTKDLVHPDDLPLFRDAGGKALSKLGEVTPLPHICFKAGDGAYRAFGGRLTNMLYVPGVEGFAFSGGLLDRNACLMHYAAE